MLRRFAQTIADRACECCASRFSSPRLEMHIARMRKEVLLTGWTTFSFGLVGDHFAVHALAG